MTKQTAIELIAQEREEQIHKHGFTVEYDANKYDEGVTGLHAEPSDLVVAAQACIYGSRVVLPENAEQSVAHPGIPLFPSSWKDNPCVEKICNKTYKDRLVIAAALLAAEIDRLIAKEANVEGSNDQMNKMPDSTEQDCGTVFPSTGPCEPSTVKPNLKSYIGTKVVLARPMSENEFLEAVKGKTKEELKQRETLGEGYEVTYEDGYVSWSPKAVFERCYREISGQERQLIHTANLSCK